MLFFIFLLKVDSPSCSVLSDFASSITVFNPLLLLLFKIFKKTQNQIHVDFIFINNTQKINLALTKSIVIKKTLYKNLVSKRLNITDTKTLKKIFSLHFVSNSPDF